MEMKIPPYFLWPAIFLLICLPTSRAYSLEDLFAFKDIKLGSHVAEINDDQCFRCRVTNSPLADTSCRLMDEYKKKITIASVPVKAISLYYFDDILATIVITFAQTYFKDVKDALKERYGSPSNHSTETYVDRRGELFDGRIYEWENSVSIIDAVQFFSSAQNSAVVYRLNFSQGEVIKTH